MKQLFYIGFVWMLCSCGGGIDEEKIIGCWTIEYIDTDGIKMRSGKYSMCLDEDGSLVQQRLDGKEKVNCEWSLESDDSLLIIHYSDRKPDTMKIIKSDDRDLHIQRKIHESTVTMYLRKQK